MINNSKLNIKRVFQIPSLQSTHFVVWGTSLSRALGIILLQDIQIPNVP